MGSEMCIRDSHAQAQAILELERSIRGGRARSDTDHDSVAGENMTSGGMTNDDVAAGR